jgi:hypothetical protein
MMPDQLWAQKFDEAQLEKHGRKLTVVELLESLRDPNSMVNKLVRDRWKVAP